MGDLFMDSIAKELVRWWGFLSSVYGHSTKPSGGGRARMIQLGPRYGQRENQIWPTQFDNVELRSIDYGGGMRILMFIPRLDPGKSVPYLTCSIALGETAQLQMI